MCVFIIIVFFFFFFKQKTAYEMRISDWSSDVCSSDLHRRPGRRHPRTVRSRRWPAAGQHRQDPDPAGGGEPGAQRRRGAARRGPARAGDQRSEEHTSELQSLMRISYAVFCLKKKKTTYAYTHKVL